MSEQATVHTSTSELLFINPLIAHQAEERGIVLPTIKLSGTAPVQANQEALLEGVSQLDVIPESIAIRSFKPKYRRPNPNITENGHSFSMTYDEAGKEPLTSIKLSEGFWLGCLLIGSLGSKVENEAYRRVEIAGKGSSIALLAAGAGSLINSLELSKDLLTLSYAFDALLVGAGVFQAAKYFPDFHRSDHFKRKNLKQAQAMAREFQVLDYQTQVRPVTDLASYRRAKLNKSISKE